MPFGVVVIVASPGSGPTDMFQQSLWICKCLTGI